MKEGGKLILWTFYNPIVYLLHSVCCTLTNFAFWLLNNSAWCHWAWSVSVYCINHCSCLLLPLWRPLKCSGRVSDFWSILAAPGHVFIGHFPFPPYFLYSLLFPLLRCSHSFEFAGYKMRNHATPFECQTKYMFRFRWGAQIVLTFHLTSSLPISVFTRRLLQVRIIGCLTFGCSSAFIIGSCPLPIVAKVQYSDGQILELLEQSIDWPSMKYYWNYWNNWPTTSYSLLEQICSGADERQMALSGVESIDTLPSVECCNINWSLCSTLGVARYVCGPWSTGICSLL